MCSDEFDDFNQDWELNDRLATILVTLKQELQGDQAFDEDYEDDDQTINADEEYPVYCDSQEPLEFCPEITAELWNEICQRQEEATGVSVEVSGINFDYGLTSTYCVPIHGPDIVLKYDNVVELLLLLFLNNS